MSNQNIIWKEFPIEITAEDGIILKGKIHYWAKDFTIQMEEPFKAKSNGGHLMYAIPAQYVTNESPRGNIKNINLIERSKNILLHLYSNKKSKC